jgi:hypothetical protein
MKLLKVEVWDGERRFNMYINPEHICNVEPRYEKDTQVIGECILVTTRGPIPCNDTMETVVARWEDAATDKPGLAL